MSLLVKAGTYTGNGSTTQTISGVGFQPKVVMIFGTDGSSDDNAGIFKTPEMTTGATGMISMLGENGQLTLGLIDSITSDGFIVRGTTNGKNVNGRAYYYLALGGTNCVTGTYTGNGNDDRNITGLGIDPDWVVVQGGTNHTFQKSTATGKTTDISQLFTSIADLTGRIQQLITDGFQVGNSTGVNTAVNTNAVTFYYFAITGSNFKSGTYSGNSTDNRDITGVGFTPVAAIVKQTSTQQGRAYSGNTGDSSSFMRANAAPAANGIQGLISDGFQVGTDATVNSSGSDYVYLAFSDTEPPATNIKTWNGIARANLKTLNGVASANIKTINGIA